ncbi:MAG TPA: hypothetical protein VNS56_08370, partial [Methylomirabilota bacterium]|nr:hypothetical protein [Methylomirabilota bacterium]
MGFVRPLPLGAGDDLRPGRALAAGAAATGAAAAAGTVAGSRRIRMWRGRVRTPRVPLTSSLTAIV